MNACRTMLVLCATTIVHTQPSHSCRDVVLAAQLAQIAYEPNDDLLRLGLADADSKLSLVEMVAQERSLMSQPQFFFATRQNILYLVIRGTDSLSDILRNLDAHPDNNFHSGFYRAAMGIQRKLADHASNPAVERLVLVGHSLGGAIALTMLLAGAAPGNLPTTVYTFGAPAICYQECPPVSQPVVSVVHGADIVPRLLGSARLKSLTSILPHSSGAVVPTLAEWLVTVPLETLQEYTHPAVSKDAVLLSNGVPVASVDDRTELLSLEAAVDAAATKFSPKALIEDHSMTSYAAAVTSSCDSGASAEAKAELMIAVEHRRLRMLVAKFVFSLAADAFLPSSEGEASQQEQRRVSLQERRLSTARLLFEEIRNANTLGNVTSAIINLYTFVDGRYFNTTWSAAEQKTWLSQVIELQQTTDTLEAAVYIGRLATAIESFANSGLGRQLFTSETSRRTLISSLQDVASQADKLVGESKTLAGWIKPLTSLALTTAGSGSVLKGAALTTSGLRVIGYPMHWLLCSCGLKVSAMAAGPVTLALVPIAVSIKAVDLLVPDDNAGNWAKRASYAAGALALPNIFQQVTANGKGFADMTKAIADKGGGAIAACVKPGTCGGMIEGLAEYSKEAATIVMASAAAAYGAYKLYEWWATENVDKVDEEQVKQIALALAAVVMDVHDNMTAAAAEEEEEAAAAEAEAKRSIIAVTLSTFVCFICGLYCLQRSLRHSATAMPAAAAAPDEADEPGNPFSPGQTSEETNPFNRPLAAAEDEPNPFRRPSEAAKEENPFRPPPSEPPPPEPPPPEPDHFVPSPVRTLIVVMYIVGCCFFLPSQMIPNRFGPLDVAFTGTLLSMPMAYQWGRSLAFDTIKTILIYAHRLLVRLLGRAFVFHVFAILFAFFLVQF